VDCEKFDRVVLDLLYDELDELTAAAARRHMDHCGRCGPIGAGLRATREVGVIPHVTPSPELSARILEAERNARSQLPLGQRVGRGVSVLAGYAMRPQLAMAAVAVLMIGVSLFFVRSRPSDRDDVRVTERGVPEADQELPTTDADRRVRAPSMASDTIAEAPMAAPKAAQAPAPSGSAPTVDPAFEEAQTAFREGRFAEAQRAFQQLATAGGPSAPTAALMAARAARHTQGCVVAAALLEDLAAKHEGTSVGHEAMWQAAECRRSLGQHELAQRDYLALADQAAYAERVEAALTGLRDAAPTSVGAHGARPAAAAPVRAAPPSTGTTSAPTTSAPTTSAQTTDSSR
jgi:hypothetical protein